MSPAKHRIRVSALHLPASLSLVSDLHPTPPRPKAVGSQPPLIFSPHHSPLHFSPLLISLAPLSSTSTSSGCVMWGLALPPRLHDRITTVSPKPFAGFHTHQGRGGCKSCVCGGGESHCARATNEQCSCRLRPDTLSQ